MFKKSKGLSLGAAPAAVMLLVIIGITCVVGLKILDQLDASETSNSSIVSTMVLNSTAGINQVTSNMTLVGIIIIMAIVITLLFAAFGGAMSGAGGL